MAYVFGLNDVKIAPVNDAGDGWDTAVDVLAATLYGLTFNMETGELEGDDIIVDAHAQPQAANIRLRLGFNTANALDVLEALTGKAQDTYDYYSMWGLGRDNLQYFGLCGKISPTQGSGDLQLFVPYIKVMSDLPLEAQKGQHMTLELQGRALYFNALWEIGKVIVNATGTAVTLPPTFASS